MNPKALLPVSIFCVIFLIYTIYFVKVVNTTKTLPPNSIARTVKQLIEERKGEAITPVTIVPEKKSIEKKAMTETSLGTKYVNFAWLNVRKDPNLVAKLLEKLNQGDSVTVLGNPSPSWTYVKTSSGIKGFVASKYLSDEAPKALALTPSLFEIPIISYHHVSDDKSIAEELNLPVINFLAQLDYLVGNGFQTLTFYELKKIHEGSLEAPKKAVILTFDDSYDDHYPVAKHLNGKGLKGVFFVITDRIGSKGYLSWEQVKKMRSWGMEIGSHGVKSADLVASTDYFINDELVRSKKIIEEKLGENIVSFAYPAGRYNNKVAELAGKAGYPFARTIDAGSRYTESQFLKLPTLRVFSPAGAKQFKVWLSP